MSTPAISPKAAVSGVEDESCGASNKDSLTGHTTGSLEKTEISYKHHCQKRRVGVLASGRARSSSLSSRQETPYTSRSTGYVEEPRCRRRSDIQDLGNAELEQQGPGFEMAMRSGCESKAGSQGQTPRSVARRAAWMDQAGTQTGRCLET